MYIAYLFHKLTAEVRQFSTPHEKRIALMIDQDWTEISNEEAERIQLAVRKALEPHLREI